jgi:hypothetical protein
MNSSKIKTCLALTMTLLGASAEARNLQDLLKDLATKQVKAAVQVKRSSVKARGDEPVCADLNGSWAGSCTLPDGTAQNVATAIKQIKCSSIQFDSDEAVSPGFVNGTSSGGIIFASAGNSGSYWNADNTVFNSDSNTAMSIFGYYENVDAKSKFYLASEKVLRVEASVNFKGVIELPAMEISCTLSKQ